MITFDDVTVTYPDAATHALSHVDLAIPEGELCLVIGETGAGKSTLLKCINGLVPHFTGGRLTGRVVVDGRDTEHHPPRELADVVGYVGQVPQAGFVTDVVEDELAYAMESLGLRADVMRRRVEEILDLMGLADVRDRPLLSLSAGQQQRVAIGSVLTAQPRVLVLDEPTSALDPPAAEEVLAALTRLVHDLGLTVVVAEHRLERVVQYADSVIALRSTAPPLYGAPADVLARSVVRPPVVELAQIAEWHPLPLSVRDARRRADGLRARLTHLPAPVVRRQPSGTVVVAAREVTAAYGDVWALRGVDMTLQAGEVTALMGRNGAGKSTLLGLFAGLREPHGGELKLPAGRRSVVLVPQEPADLLWSATVAAECTAADAEWRLPAGATHDVLQRLAPELDPHAHPRDLSEGQRLMLCLAIMLVGRPRVVALDEPTRGLDYGAKQRLVALLHELADNGTCVVLATHDVELVAEVADRVVILAEGEVVADGPAADVVTSSPVFAPQVAKVFAPVPLLTVAQARAAMA